MHSFAGRFVCGTNWSNELDLVRGWILSAEYGSNFVHCCSDRVLRISDRLNVADGMSSGYDDIVDRQHCVHTD
jgi:hypothetical protein